MPPLSGQRTGNLDKVVCRHSLHRPNASMIKQKKIVGDFLFFCSMILAFSLCRLWRRTVCPVPPRVDSLLKRTSLSPTLMLADGWASSPEYLGQGSLRLSLIKRGAVVPRPSNGHLCHFRSNAVPLFLAHPMDTSATSANLSATSCSPSPFRPPRDVVREGQPSAAWHLPFHLAEDTREVGDEENRRRRRALRDSSVHLPGPLLRPKRV